LKIELYETINHRSSEIKTGKEIWYFAIIMEDLKPPFVLGKKEDDYFGFSQLTRIAEKSLRTMDHSHPSYVT
jgi:hypothetical protein